MATADVIKFDPLLSAIADGQPVGPDPRSNPSHQSPFWELRHLRDRSLSAEKRIRDAEGDPNEEDRLRRPEFQPQWPEVEKKAEQFLISEAKSLEVVAWYIEALVRLHGFAGLRDGARLARELLERYWDQIYPQGDDSQSRVALLGGLGSTLREPILRIPLTDLAAGGRSRLDFLKSEEDFRQSSDLATSPFCASLCQDIDDCLLQLQQLDACLQTTCKLPGYFSELAREIHKDYRQWLRELYGNKLGTSVESQPPTDTSPVATETQSDSFESDTYSPARSREQAFRKLREVADFFERTEPHSPISSCLRQAVRWGQLKLPELYAELIPDEKIRSELFRLVGIDKLPDSTPDE